MSELKGMKVFMATEPTDNDQFYIKKSIRDGSLAVFDEMFAAERQVRLNGESTELREGIVMSLDVFNKSVDDEKIISKENARLTELCAKHATRADEIYEILKVILDDLDSYGGVLTNNRIKANKVLDKSRIEAEE